VPLVVQVETVWVLESGYGSPRANVAQAQALAHLEVNHAFVAEDEELCHRALELFRSSNADYADCLILSNGRARGLVLYTFDNRLGKRAGAAPVSTG